MKGSSEFFGEQVMGMEGRITTNIREEDHGGFVCYWLNDEFYVMVMPCVGSQEDMIEFWLCRENYGIHSFINFHAAKTPCFSYGDTAALF